MKTKASLIGFLLILWCGVLPAQTIYSTLSGGDWNDTLTWVGYEIPTYTDDVVIAGPVTIIPDFNWTYCHHLNIQSAGSLTGGSNASLRVYGNLTNYGVLASSGASNLNITLWGNLSNHGTLALGQLDFSGGNDKSLFSLLDLTIQQLNVNDTCDLILASNIRLINCELSCYGVNKGVLLQNHQLEFYGGYLRGNLYGDGSVKFQDEAYLYDARLYGNVSLLGEVICWATSYFYGNISLQDTLYNKPDAYSNELRIYGDFVNNGLITQETGFNFSVSFYGNLTNNGIIELFRMSFEGDKSHTIHSSNALNPQYFTISYSDTLLANSDLLVYNSAFEINVHGLLYLNGNDLTLHASSLSGKLFAQGGNLVFEDDSWITQCWIMDQISLLGKVQIGGGDCRFYNYTLVQDTLQSRVGGAEVQFFGPLVNKGVIQNGAINLPIKAYSTVINEGVFDNYSLAFQGSNPQSLKTKQAISVDYLTQNNPAGVVADSIVSLENVWLNGGNNPIHLGVEGIRFDSVVVNNVWFYADSAFIFQTNTSYLSSCNSYGPLEFRGNVKLYGGGNHFYEQVVIKDTLSTSYNYYGTQAYFHGALVNEGRIMGNSFQLNAYADLVNHGVWENDVIRLVGSGIQNITCSEPFSVSQISSTDTAGYLNMLSDWKLHQVTLSLTWEELHLNGNQLYLDSSSIHQAELWAGGGSLYLTNNSYLYTMNAHESMSLHGIVQTLGDQIHFYGPVEVMDTLQKYPAYYSSLVYFHDDVVNYGLIHSDLYTGVYGDIDNQGVWSNVQLSLAATQQQVMKGTQPYSCNMYIPNASNTVVLESPVSWQGVSLSGQMGAFNLNGYELSLAGGNLHDVQFYGYQGAIRGADGAYLYHNNFYGPLELRGNLAFHGTENSFYEEITIKDTLSKHPDYYHSSVSFYGDLINEGLITGTNFSVLLHADYYHQGYDAITRFDYVGNVDQYLYLVDEQMLHSQVRMNASMAGAASYEWFRNDTSLVTLNLPSYANPGSLNLITTDTIDSSYLGSYYCQTDLGNSRTIFIQHLYENFLVDLGPNQVICEGDSLYLTATIQGGNPPFSYVWSTGHTIPEISLLPAVADTFFVLVTDAFGAITADTLLVEVLETPAFQLPASAAICQGDSLMLMPGISGASYLWSTGSTDENLWATESGVYSLTLTAGNGCAFSQTTDLVVHSLPIIPLNAEEEACEGNSIVLDAGNFASYEWSNQATTATQTIWQTGTYALTVTDSNGCSNNASVLVSIHPNPVVDLGADFDLWLGDTALLAAPSGYASYAWSNGETQAEIQVTLGGTYQLTVTNSYGCSSSDAVTITLIDPSNLPTWTYTNTGIQHTILFEETASVMLNMDPVPVGSYIGVFYTVNGNLTCGGYTIWEEQTTALTAWGNDTLSAQKDGFDPGETMIFKLWIPGIQEEYIASPIYYPQTMMPNLGQFAENGLSGVWELSAYSFVTQNYQVPANWSYISTYVELFDPAIPAWMQSIANELIILKSDIGQIYWPPFILNPFNAEVGKAYQVKVSAPTTLSSFGEPVVPEEVDLNLPAGWSMLGYLRQEPGSIETIMSPYDNQIVIIKNTAGGAYWPDYGLNTIGNMNPGEGYYIKTWNAFTFTYPANSLALKQEEILLQNPVHFTAIPATGNSMSLLILPEAWPMTPVEGDEIAVRNSSGQWVGSVVIQHRQAYMSIWGKDEWLGSESGLDAGEPFELVWWSKATKQEFLANKIEFLLGQGRYELDGIAVVSSLQFEEVNTPQLKVFPNPASDRITLSFTGKQDVVQLSVYSATGEEVMTQSLQGKWPTDLSVSDLAPGSYTIRLKTADGEWNRTFLKID